MKSPCIHLTMLARYITGKISFEDKLIVEEHLSNCDICLNEWISANSLIKDRELFGGDDPGRIKTVFEWIKQTFTDAIHSPALAYRSADDAQILEYIEYKRDKNDLHTELHIEKIGSDVINIRATVFNEDHPANNIRLILTKKGGGSISRAPKDISAYFENLAFGTYQADIKQHAELKDTFFFEITSKGMEIHDPA